VTANLFPVLGAAPIRGRVFTKHEDVPNGPKVAISGYGLWQRRYGADPTMVGRTIPINGAPHEVTPADPATFVAVASS